MKYIDVLSNFEFPKSKINPIPLIVDQCDGILISLVTVLRKTIVNNTDTFTLDTEKISNYHNKYIKGKDCTLWIDSGGFNILGENKFDKENLESYIAIYNQYLSQHNEFDRIFSLDFPLAVKTKKADNSWFNTRKNVREWNYRSLSQTVATLSKFPQLRKKFTFVYQFRTPALYKIWSDLYLELGFKDKIVNRAIGGLVGSCRASRMATKKELLFSPVIAPAYRCFHDYLEAGNFDNDFSLHFLGISNDHDQFVIIFLERLFNYYLSQIGQKTRAFFSIDTRANSKKMEMKIRTTGLYSFDPDRYHNKIHKDYKIRDIPDSRLKRVYSNEYPDYIACEINDKLTWDENVECAADFYPLSIYSNNSLNKFFDQFISDNNLIGMLLESKNKTKLESDVENMFNEKLPEPTISNMVSINVLTPLYDIFKSPKFHSKKTNLDNKIKTSISRIHDFHKWFTKDRDQKRLNRLINKFITDIGIKDELQ